MSLKVIMWCSSNTNSLHLARVMDEEGRVITPLCLFQDCCGSMVVYQIIHHIFVFYQESHYFCISGLCRDAKHDILWIVVS